MTQYRDSGRQNKSNVPVTDYRHIAVWIDEENTLKIDEKFIKSGFFTSTDVIKFLNDYRGVQVKLDIIAEMPDQQIKYYMDIMRSNCIESLWLAMYGNNDLEGKFFNLLSGCSRIKSLKLNIGWYSRGSNHSSRHAYPQCFKYLPNLTQLEISHEMHTHSRNVKYGKSFVSGFSFLSKLETLKLHHLLIKFEDEAIDLIESIPSIAPLNDVSLEFFVGYYFFFIQYDLLKTKNRLQNPVNRLMCRFPGITTLHLGDFEFQNFNIQSLQSAKIESLSIKAETLWEEDIERFAKVSLKKVVQDVCVHPVYHSIDNIALFKAAAAAKHLSYFVDEKVIIDDDAASILSHSQLDSLIIDLGETISRSGARKCDLEFFSEKLFSRFRALSIWPSSTRTPFFSMRFSEQAKRWLEVQSSVDCPALVVKKSYKHEYNEFFKNCYKEFLTIKKLQLGSGWLSGDVSPFDGDLKWISKLHQLEDLYLDNFFIDSDLMKILATLPCLEYLSFHRCQFDPDVTENDFHRLAFKLKGFSFCQINMNNDDRANKSRSELLFSSLKNTLRKALDFLKIQKKSLSLASILKGMHVPLIEVNILSNPDAEVISAIAENSLLKVLILNEWYVEGSPSGFLNHLDILEEHPELLCVIFRDLWNVEDCKFEKHHWMSILYHNQKMFVLNVLSAIYEKLSQFSCHDSYTASNIAGYLPFHGLFSGFRRKQMPSLESGQADYVQRLIRQ